MTVPLLTPKDIQRQLSLERRAAYRIMHGMRHYQIGRMVRVERGVFEKWLVSGKAWGAANVPQLFTD